MSNEKAIETDNGCIVEISDDCLLIGEGGFVLTYESVSYEGKMAGGLHKVIVANRHGHVGTLYFSDKSEAKRLVGEVRSLERSQA